MEVYKYTKKKYLHQFFDKGIIRIGTIHWYRDCENKKIQDPLEGRTKYIIEPRKESLTLSKEQANAITNDYQIKGNICISPETTFSDFLNVPNAFIFCTSLNNDKILLKKFEAEGSYKIAELQRFTNLLSEEISKQFPLRLSATSRVVYVPSKEHKITNENKDLIIRTTPYNETGVKNIYVEDYFTKPLEFQGEVEYRFIFMPQKVIEKDCFVSIRNKKLVECCEIMDF
jgi:hypothetical protein